MKMRPGEPPRLVLLVAAAALLALCATAGRAPSRHRLLAEEGEAGGQEFETTSESLPRRFNEIQLAPGLEFAGTSTTSKRDDEPANANTNSTGGEPGQQATTGEERFPLYLRLIGTLACLIIFTIGVCGNLLVPLVVIKTKYLRNSTNLFLINLSMADLLVLIVCMPTVLIELHSRPETWLLGETMCKLSNFVEMLAANGSIFTILAISFERYYAICKPLKAGYKCTRLRATIIICIIWLLSTLLTSPILIMAKSSQTTYLDGSLVYNCILETDSYWHKMYVFVSMFAFFCLPLLVLMLVYWLISRRLIRENLAMMDHDRPHLAKQSTGANNNNMTKSATRHNFLLDSRCNIAQALHMPISGLRAASTDTKRSNNNNKQGPLHAPLFGLKRRRLEAASSWSLSAFFKSMRHPSYCYHQPEDHHQQFQQRCGGNSRVPKGKARGVCCPPERHSGQNLESALLAYPTSAGCTPAGGESPSKTRAQKSAAHNEIGITNNNNNNHMGRAGKPLAVGKAMSLDYNQTGRRIMPDLVGGVGGDDIRQRAPLLAGHSQTGRDTRALSNAEATTTTTTGTGVSTNTTASSSTASTDIDTCPRGQPRDRSSSSAATGPGARSRKGSLPPSLLLGGFVGRLLSLNNLLAGWRAHAVPPNEHEDDDDDDNDDDGVEDCDYDKRDKNGQQEGEEQGRDDSTSKQLGATTRARCDDAKMSTALSDTIELIDRLGASEIGGPGSSAGQHDGQPMRVPGSNNNNNEKNLISCPARRGHASSSSGQVGERVVARRGPPGLANGNDRAIRNEELLGRQLPAELFADNPSQMATKRTKRTLESKKRNKIKSRNRAEPGDSYLERTRFKPVKGFSVSSSTGSTYTDSTCLPSETSSISPSMNNCSSSSAAVASTCRNQLSGHNNSNTSSGASPCPSPSALRPIQCEGQKQEEDHKRCVQTKSRSTVAANACEFGTSGPESNSRHSSPFEPISGGAGGRDSGSCSPEKQPELERRRLITGVVDRKKVAHFDDDDDGDDDDDDVAIESPIRTPGLASAAASEDHRVAHLNTRRRHSACCHSSSSPSANGADLESGTGSERSLSPAASSLSTGKIGGPKTSWLDNGHSALIFHESQEAEEEEEGEELREGESNQSFEHLQGAAAATPICLGQSKGLQHGHVCAQPDGDKCPSTLTFTRFAPRDKDGPGPAGLLLGGVSAFTGPQEAACTGSPSSRQSQGSTSTVKLSGPLQPPSPRCPMGLPAPQVDLVADAPPLESEEQREEEHQLVLESEIVDVRERAPPRGRVVRSLTEDRGLPTSRARCMDEEVERTRLFAIDAGLRPFHDQFVCDKSPSAGCALGRHSIVNIHRHINKVNLIAIAHNLSDNLNLKRLSRRSGSQPIVSHHMQIHAHLPPGARHHHNQIHDHHNHHHHNQYNSQQQHTEFQAVRDVSKKQQMDSRRQVVAMLAFVVACFFILFFPYRVFTVWIILSTEDQVQSLGMETYYNLTYLCRILIYLHSAINPIAYNLISTKFRRAFMSILLCRGSATRRNFTSDPHRYTYDSKGQLVKDNNHNYLNNHYHNHYCRPGGTPNGSSASRGPRSPKAQTARATETK